MRTQRLAKKQQPRKGQRYFWTATWQRGEREASADIEKGRVKSFKDVAGLIEDLHRQRG